MTEARPSVPECATRNKSGGSTGRGAHELGAPRPKLLWPGCCANRVTARSSRRSARATRRRAGRGVARPGRATMGGWRQAMRRIRGGLLRRDLDRWWRLRSTSCRSPVCQRFTCSTNRTDVDAGALLATEPPPRRVKSLCLVLSRRPLRPGNRFSRHLDDDRGGTDEDRLHHQFAGRRRAAAPVPAIRSRSGRAGCGGPCVALSRRNGGASRASTRPACPWSVSPASKGRQPTGGGMGVGGAAAI